MYASSHCALSFTIHTNLSFLRAPIHSFRILSIKELEILFKNLNEIKCFIDDNTIEGLIECGLTGERKAVVAL